MGCGVNCLKGFLITINVFFGIVGAVMVIVSIFTLTSGNERATEELETELADLKKIPINIGLVDPNPFPVGGAEVDVESLLRGRAVYGIIVGGILFCIAILGSIGVCYNNGCLVAMYVVILVLLLIIQATILGLSYFGVLDDQVKGRLKEKLEEEYVSIDAYDGFSLTSNLVMSNLDCCGIDDYNDFNNATLWRNVRNFTIGGVDQEVTLVTPMACCKFDSAFAPLSQDCASNPTNTTSNYKEGCWEALKDRMEEDRAWVIGFIAGILGFQLLLIVAAIYVICFTEEEKELDY